MADKSQHPPTIDLDGARWGKGLMRQAVAHDFYLCGLLRSDWAAAQLPATEP